MISLEHIEYKLVDETQCLYIKWKTYLYISVKTVTGHFIEQRDIMFLY